MPLLFLSRRPSADRAWGSELRTRHGFCPALTSRLRIGLGDHVSECGRDVVGLIRRRIRKQFAGEVNP